MEHWRRRNPWPLIIGLLVLWIAFVCIRAAVNVYKNSRSELRTAAKRLGVEPTLDGITGYIEESIKVGMPRAEVEHILYEITPDVRIVPWETEPNRTETCYQIVVNSRSSSSLGAYLTFETCYDHSGILASLSQIRKFR